MSAEVIGTKMSPRYPIWNCQPVRPVIAAIAAIGYTRIGTRKKERTIDEIFEAMRERAANRLDRRIDDIGLLNEWRRACP